MADTTVETRFTLQDRLTAGINRVSGGLSALGRHFEKTENKAQALNSVVGGIGGKLAMLGGAIGGTALLGNIIKVNEEFENTSIRIAGTLKAFDLAPTIGVAQEEAKKAMTIIQDMAATLPGETEEYINVFATALPKAITAGMRDISSIATLTSKWMALASSNQVDSMQAGMDLYRMLSGQAGADVRMWSVLQAQVGMTTDAFNKLAKEHPDQIVTKITEVLQKYDDQQGLAADSFAAKMGELQSHFKELQRLAGAELFTQAKSSLEEMNTYLRENKTELVRMGSEFLKTVIPALKMAVPILKFMVEHARELATTAVTFAGIWAAGTLIGALNNIVTLFQSMRVALTAARVEAQTLGATNMAGGVGGALGTTVATLTIAAAAVYLTSEGVDKFTKGAGDMATQAAKLTSGVWETQIAPSMIRGRETYQKGDLDDASRRAVAQELQLRGTYAPMMERMQKTIFGDVPTYAREYTAAHMTELDALREMYQTALVSPMRGAADDVVKFAMAMGWTKQTLTGRADVLKVGTPTEAKPVKAPKGRTEAPVTNFYNSRFDIKQNFAEGFDPDRIAVAFAADLGRAGEMKTQSSYNQAFTTR